MPALARSWRWAQSPPPQWSRIRVQSPGFRKPLIVRLESTLLPLEYLGFEFWLSGSAFRRNMIWLFDRPRRFNQTAV